LVFHNATPEIFKQHLKTAINFVLKNNRAHNLLIIKSWNEWAEGNYLEPDKQWGHKFLESIKEALAEIEVIQ